MYEKCQEECMYAGMAQAILYCSLKCNGVPKTCDIRKKTEAQLVDVKPVDPLLEYVQ